MLVVGVFAWGVMLLLLTLRSELQHANNQHSNPLTAKRILVYGVCGSGKTTFARRLSERTGIPWTSVDDMAWLPGWVNTTEEYQREQAERICAADEWILDTAYGKWIDIPLGRVELILALDYPRWFSLQRLLRRTFSRVIDKKPICNGNVESWRTMFSRDSIIVWHFKSWKRKRQRIRAWTASKDGPKVIAFANARGAERWLQSQQPVRRESRQPDERQP